MPNTEFLISVGNISAVCSVMIAYTEVMQKRLSIANTRRMYSLSLDIASTIRRKAPARTKSVNWESRLVDHFRMKIETM